MQSRLSLGWLFLPGTGVWGKGGLQRDGEKKGIYLLYQKGYGINKVGKGQDKPKVAVTTELPSSSCTTMRTGFFG